MSRIGNVREKDKDTLDYHYSITCNIEERKRKSIKIQIPGDKSKRDALCTSKDFVFILK